MKNFEELQHYLIFTASQEITINTADIAKREKSETISLMPPGLASPLSVQDFASLLEYLESLAKEPAKK